MSGRHPTGETSPRICLVSELPFTASEAHNAQIERMGDMRGLLKGERLPALLVHPLVQMRELYCFGNLLYLYRCTSALSGKPQISRYNPALGYRICTVDEFNNEEIDNTDFGRPYDFSRPFFEQWNELMHRAYLPPLNNTNVEGSDYVNGADNVKDCYLCFSVIHSQECMYCVSQYYGNNNLLCVGTMRCQYCYACVEIDSCYECQHCTNCTNCQTCIACDDCIGCGDCAGCSGLRNVRYHIFNKAYSKEEYKRIMGGWDFADCRQRGEFLAHCRQITNKQGSVAPQMSNAENATGNYIRNSQNIENGYFSSNCQDCGYIVLGIGSRDCWHGFAVNSELLWLAGGVSSQNVAFSYSVFYGESCLYCYHIYQHCSFCFGCAGLRRKSYCILNKQYERAEFLELLPRIIAHMKTTGEWGRFFPVSYAPFYYEESVATDFFEPLSKDVLQKRNHIMSPESAPRLEQGGVPAASLPVNSRDIDIAQWSGKTILCDETGQTFNLQRRELEFYRQFNIPLPRLHWRKTLRDLMHSRGLIPAP